MIRSSIVICTKDRRDDLARCLAGVAMQTAPPDEVIVVDASAAPAHDLVAAFAGWCPGCRVRIDAAAPGLPRQRNHGADLATGDVVVFLDDDVVLEPGYLAAILEVYAQDADGRIGGVGGAQVPDPTPRETWPRRVAGRLFLLDGYGRGILRRSGRAEYCLSPAETTDVDFLSGCNMSYRRAVLDRHRFDERLNGYALGEDLQFSYRVSRERRLVLTPAARCDHRVARSGRPDPDRFRTMSVFNHYLFFREHVARGPLDWAAWTWATFGAFLLAVRAPRRRGLYGALRGYGAIWRHAWHGELPGGGPLVAGAGLPPVPSTPAITVVVPARNEAAHLGRCVASILSQRDVPATCEVVVVENGSTDRTREVAETLAQSDPRVRVLVTEASNQAAAMNAGVAVARGTIVARVDAHSWIAPDYLAGVVAAFAAHPAAAGVGGRFLPAGEHVLERVAGLARSSVFGVGGGYGTDREERPHPVRTVQCGAYRRDALVACGGFDEAMAYGEDEELNWRLAKQGGAIILDPRLRQYYRPRPTLRALARQYWNYGHGRLRVVLKHPDFLQPKHLIPSAFLIGALLLLLAAPVLTPARVGLIVLATLYAAVLVAAAVAARRDGWAALLVPFAIASMHVGYGAGMLSGAAGRLAGRARGSRS